MTVKRTISPMIKSSIISAAMMIAFKLYAFIKQAMIAGYYGISLEMDIYSLARAFITFPLALASETLFTAVVSQYTFVRIGKGREESDRVISSVIILVSLVAVLYIGGIIFLSEPITNFLSKGRYEGELWDTLRYCICLTGIYISFFMMTSVLGAVSESHKKFVLPRLESFIGSSVVIIMTVLFAEVYHIKSLVWADVIAIVIYMLIQLYVLKDCFTFRLFFKWDWKPIKQILWLMFPLLLGNTSYRVNQMVDTFLASRFDGGAAVLSYSHVLEQLVTLTLGTSMGSVLFSYMTELSANNQKELMDRNAKQMFRICLLVTVPISFISMAKAAEIVKIVFFRGSFDIIAVKLTAGAFLGYAFGFTFAVMKNLLTKYLYAKKNTKVPAFLGTLSAIGNIILSIQLSKWFQISGITYATSIMSLLSMILIVLYINQNHMQLINKRSFFFMVKVLISGICAFILARSIKVVDFSELISLIVYIFIYLFSYLIVAYFMKIEELQTLTDLLKRRGEN